MKKTSSWVKKCFVMSILVLCWLPTISAAVNIDVEMRLNDGGFVSYDHFKAELYMNNLDQLTPDATIFGILEVLGEFFFWPSFSAEVDFDLMDIDPGEAVVIFLEFDFENIDEFIPFGPMTFWGAWFLDMETWNYGFQEFWLDSAHKWTPTPIPTNTPTAIPTNTPANTATPTPPPVDDVVFIPGGSFWRGSSDEEPCRNADETDHQVRLSRGFYMMDKEVTRYSWKTIRDFFPDLLPGDPSNTYFSPNMGNPVQSCSWNEAVLYANVISLLSGRVQCYYLDKDFLVPVSIKNYDSVNIYCNFDADGWRLPTEAEWEYACRAGTVGPFSKHESQYNESTCGSCDSGTLPTLESYCWFCANTSGTTELVGTKKPNPWGLYDMHGNVFEWCWDWYGEYPTGNVTDPTGASSSHFKVARGGSWGDMPSLARSAYRKSLQPKNASYTVGFRLVATYNPGVPTPTPAPTAPPDIPLLVYFAPGSFIMGSPGNESCREGNEIEHTVTIPHGFYMMDSEVTRLQWAALKSQQPTLPYDPSDTAISPTLHHAAQNVSWYDAILFTNLSSIQLGFTRCYYKDANFTIPVDATNYSSGVIYWNREADGWRLPTEAEWEYACRAGTISAFSCEVPEYNDANCGLCFPGTHPTLEEYCWYCSNQSPIDQEVRSKKPNPAGLYDMHGNMWEWCWDWLGDYPTNPVTDPVGPDSGSQRVTRGGGWPQAARYLRSAFRWGSDAAFTKHDLSFRMVRTVF